MTRRGVPAFGAPLLCDDCGVDTGHIAGIGEFYMVTPEIWAEAGMEEGILCIGCLEERLGRQLIREDFLKCPLTDEPFPKTSDRLLSRLGQFQR